MDFSEYYFLDSQDNWWTIELHGESRFVPILLQCHDRSSEPLVVNDQLGVDQSETSSPALMVLLLY